MESPRQDDLRQQSDNESSDSHQEKDADSDNRVTGALEQDANSEQETVKNDDKGEIQTNRHSDSEIELINEDTKNEFESTEIEMFQAKDMIDNEEKNEEEMLVSENGTHTLENGKTADNQLNLKCKLDLENKLEEAGLIEEEKENVGLEKAAEVPAMLSEERQRQKYEQNDENGNLPEISEDLLVVKQQVDEKGNVIPSGGETESAVLDESIDIDEQENGLIEQNVEIIENSGLDSLEQATLTELDQKKLDGNEDNQSESDKSLIPGNLKEDEEDDISSATDTSNLANIIVKHVLDTAVSYFNNDTSFSSSDGLEKEEDLVSKESFELKVDYEIESKHSDDHEEKSTDEEETEMANSKILVETLSREECLPAGAESTGRNYMEFDENGNRKTPPEPSYNPVAMDIAVAMVNDEKEAEKTRITDQIRDDIQEISEHISLNDTVETEVNMSKSIQNGDERSSCSSSENEVAEKEPIIELLEGKFLLGRQQSEESPCGSQGLQKLAPLPNYPDFPINYGNYKVCRNLSPSEKECLIIETGEMILCKDKDKKTVESNAMSHGLYEGHGKSDKVNSQEEHLDQSEILKNSVRSSTPQHTFNNSQQMFAGQNSSPPRNGECSFRIMKNSYDLRQSPITSPRNESRPRNIPSDQSNVLENIGYAHVNLSQSRHLEDDTAVSGLSRNQHGLYRHYDDQSFESSTQQVGSPQKLNNRIQSTTMTSKNLYQTEGEIDLSDPSVMVRYQRNILSQNMQQNNANVSVPTHSNQGTTNTQQPADYSFQNGGSDIDRNLLSQIYAKYGNSSQSRTLTESFSDVSGSVSTPHRSGPVPGYRTLHEQQNTWMEMFKTLEEKHQLDLQQQNRLHKEALFNLQQHMEDELFNQQKSFREKLTMHKEALSRSLNRSLSPIHANNDEQNRSYSRMNDSHVSRTTDDLSHSRDGTLSYQETFQTHDSLLRNRSPSWREIYKEIRGIEASDEEPSPRENLRRSLEKDFSRSSQVPRSNDEIECQQEKRQPLSPREHPIKPNNVDSPKGGVYSSPVASPRERPSRSGNKELPRAGVYSSPMPILRGKVNNTQPMQTTPKREDKNVNTCDRVTSPSMSEKKLSSSLQRHLESQHQERLSQQAQRDSELLGDSTTSDDVYLSASMRVSLREKHAKHMADLREYYEKELRDLRQSLLSDMTEDSSFKRVSGENQNLVIENRLLREKLQDLENELSAFSRRCRELEQLNSGLEVRAKEYAENYNESQAKLSNFRSKMEELQFYYREKDETAQQLEYQVKHLNEKLRTAKKSNQDITDQIQKERGILQKISEKYDAAEREQKILKESLNSTENKLYDARTEIVELKRIVSRLELENKRLSRENDNLHHKRMHPGNMTGLQSSFHDSFESPSSDYVSSPQRDTTPASINSPRGGKSPRNDTSSQKTDNRHKRDNSFQESERLNGSAVDLSIQNTSKASTNSLLRTKANELEQRNDSNISVDSSDISPVMRAEQDLYRLRDMMKQISQTPTEVPKLKLQKKFYGSDIQTQTVNGDYSPASSPKIQRKKSPNNSPKTKTRKYPETSNGHVTSQRSTSKLNINPEEFSSPTRFDIRMDIHKSKVPKRHPPDGEPQIGDGHTKKRLRPKDEQRSKAKNASKPKKGVNGTHDSTKESRSDVEDTLNKVRSGEYISRPEWEDLYTSMAKPDSQSSQPLPREEKIRDRLGTITDLEHRYDDLNAEKRKLESALSRLPAHGKGRQEQERVEEKLDQLERELGSVRMSLKRYNVLKTA